MKTLRFLVTTFIVLCCWVNATAQEVYNSFLEEGKAWHYRVYKYHPETTYKTTLFVCGDTTINNIQYKKICQDRADNFQYGLREDGGKIREDFGDGLVYDFGMEVGDEYLDMRLAAIDTIKVGERLFRRFRFVHEPSGHAEYWIDGIGGGYALTMPFGATGVTVSFLSCDVNGETILTSDDILNQTSYHGSGTFISHPCAEFRNDRQTISYDLQGRLVKDKPSKGLYIKDGRKQLVR